VASQVLQFKTPVTSRKPEAASSIFSKEAIGLRYIDRLDEKLKHHGIEAWLDADLSSLVLLRIFVDRSWMQHGRAVEVLESLIDPCPFNTVSLSALAALPYADRAVIYEECVLVGGLQSI
jgi:hypothetical protein